MLTPKLAPHLPDPSIISHSLIPKLENVIFTNSTSTKIDKHLLFQEQYIYTPFRKYFFTVRLIHDSKYINEQTKSQCVMRTCALISPSPTPTLYILYCIYTCCWHGGNSKPRSLMPGIWRWKIEENQKKWERKNWESVTEKWLTGNLINACQISPAPMRGPVAKVLHLRHLYFWLRSITPYSTVVIAVDDF